MPKEEKSLKARTLGKAGNARQLMMQNHNSRLWQNQQIKVVNKE